MADDDKNLGIGLQIAEIVVNVSGAATEAGYLREKAEIEAEQHEQNARLAALKAAQEEAERLRTLRKTIAKQLAQGAALGFDPMLSRSFLALQKDTRTTARRDISNIRLTGLVTQDRELLAAHASRVGAEAATAAGGFKVFSSILSGGIKIAKIRKEARIERNKR